MDIILEKSDEIFLNSFYKIFENATIIDFNPNSTKRQCISLWLIAMFGVNVLYFTLATLSYFCLFDKRLLNHPKVCCGRSVAVSKSIFISKLVFEKPDFKGNMGMLDNRWMDAWSRIASN